MSLRIPVWELKILFDLMYRKFIKHYKDNLPDLVIPDTPLKISGYVTKGKKKSSEGQSNLNTEKGIPKNLCDLINSDDAVIAYLESYNQKLKQQDFKGQQQVAHKPIYEIARKVAEVIDAKEVYSLDKIYVHIFYIFLGTKGRDEFKDKYLRTIEFTGYYYSVIKNDIGEFNVSIIQPLINEEEGESKQLIVEEVGFHDNAPKNILTGFFFSV